MIVRRPLRAPAEDGALLTDPPRDQVAALLAENRRRLANGPAILGLTWQEMRRLARDEAMKAARAYFARLGEPFPHSDADSLLLSGHQPELVHPGVWVKHFALNGLAKRHGATPLHLIVDYDRAKSAVLALPAFTGAAEAPVQLRTISFTPWVKERPYEELKMRSPRDLDFIAESSEPVWRDWGFQPLLPTFWAEVHSKAQRLELVSDCFAAARRALERRWGCHNGEVPVSDLCRSGGFACFARHLLANLPRFHRIYNDCVREYRRVNGIRSLNHPVPELMAGDGDWLEAPFWIWQIGATHRSRLFARVTRTGIEVRTYGPGYPVVTLPATSPPAADLELEARGSKIRPRAITNTLFARLFVGDLFLHGIGGAKYDELTDEIIRRFYGIEPPAYLVVTGTLRLPLPTLPATEEQRRDLLRQLRSVRWNPQRHLTGAAAGLPEVRKSLAEREHWVHRQPETRRGRRERYAALRNLTDQLRNYVDADPLQRDLEQCERQLAANVMLRRRDYAACLYPEEQLRKFLTQVL